MTIAVPSKGRLQQTLDLLRAAGIKPMEVDDRALVIPTSWGSVELVTASPRTYCTRSSAVVLT